MKIFDIDWYKWATGLLLTVLGSGMGYVISEIKDVEDSSVSYTDKTFERYRENQEAILNSAIRQVKSEIRENNKKINSTVSEKLKEEDEILINMELVMESYAELAKIDRAHIRKELRALVSFAQDSRNRVIDLSARMEERR